MDCPIKLEIDLEKPLPPPTDVKVDNDFIVEKGEDHRITGVVGVYLMLCITVVQQYEAIGFGVVAVIPGVFGFVNEPLCLSYALAMGIISLILSCFGCCFFTGCWMPLLEDLCSILPAYIVCCALQVILTVGILIVEGGNFWVMIVLFILLVNGMFVVLYVDWERVKLSKPSEYSIVARLQNLT